MRRFLTLPSLLVACTAGATALLACGGISDPSKSGGASEQTATVTGRLTGSAVPSGARVALLWRTSGPSRVLVAADVPVVGSTFTMTIGTPPESAFVAMDEGDRAAFEDDETAPSVGSSTSGSGGTGSSSPGVPPPSSGSSGSSGTSSSSGGSTSGSPSPLPANVGLRPMDNVTGTVVTDAMSVALGGFVIYVDTNGNGQLDVEPNGSLTTSDTIVGGNRELFLAHLRGGGTLAYEKLRDKAGILPVAGLNLMWSENERWLPLTAIELGLSSAKVLPREVCSGPGSEPPSYTETAPSRVVCAPDGRSYWYESGPCTTSPTPPPGLCSDDAPDVSYGCGGAAGIVSRLPPGEIPAGWPCPVDPDSVTEDAGPPNVKPSVDDAGAP